MRFLILSVLILNSFALAYDPVATERLVARVRQVSATPVWPVVVFDLDDTLFDTRTRSRLILLNFVEDPKIEDSFPNETHLIRTLRASDIGWDTEQSLKNIGITDKDFLAQAVAYWRQGFFSDDFCDLDETLPGAAPYVQRLWRAGAYVVYLTGRLDNLMRRCTISALRQNNFPMEGHTYLSMKDQKEMGDLEFKKKSLSMISGIGQIVGGFDNEPININTMKETFPESLMVYVDTIHSPRPDVPAVNIPWVHDFLKTDYHGES